MRIPMTDVGRFVGVGLRPTNGDETVRLAYYRLYSLCRSCVTDFSLSAICATEPTLFKLVTQRSVVAALEEPAFGGEFAMQTENAAIA